jgi:transcriptional accessory protein Tex/SPT6
MSTTGIIRQIAERIKEVLDAVNAVANNNLELLGEHGTVSFLVRYAMIPLASPLCLSLNSL